MCSISSSFHLYILLVYSVGIEHLELNTGFKNEYLEAKNAFKPSKIPDLLLLSLFMRGNDKCNTNTKIMVLPRNQMGRKVVGLTGLQTRYISA